VSAVRTGGVALAVAIATLACRSDPVLSRVPANAATARKEATQVERRTYYADHSLHTIYQALQQADGRETRHGRETEFDQQGARIAERFFRHGEPAGNWLRWWPNGNQRMEIQYRGPDVATTMRWWHENGALAEQGLARDAVKDGEWSSWTDAGVLVEQGSYAGGRRVGHWRFWRADGTRKEEGDFAAGRRTGKWTFYDEAGNELVRAR
jgi:antitoxin component YwqK of YwqJK toxin-antitoxin module